jgi:hypothetical protein
LNKVQFSKSVLQLQKQISPQILSTGKCWTFLAPSSLIPLSHQQLPIIIIIIANLAASLAADNWVPPLGLVLASAVADVVSVAVGVAVADGKAVGEARKTMGHTVEVASDTLLQAWHFNFAASDGNVAGGGVIEVDLVRELDCLIWSVWGGRNYLFNALGVAGDAGDLAAWVAAAGDVLGADVPGVDFSLDGKGEGEENGKSGELHVECCKGRLSKLGGV